MSKAILLLSLPLSLVSFCYAQTSEEITITTYYPSPYGVYEEMDVNYLDFKNNEYQEAFPTNLPAVEEGRLFYDKNTKEIKYSFDGSSWSSLAGGSCPAGFTDTGYGYCIQTDENLAMSWYDASDHCADNHGARLCIYSEWYNSCINNKAANMTGNWEWVDEWRRYPLGDPEAFHAGSVGCSPLSDAPPEDSFPFRCCRSR